MGIKCLIIAAGSGSRLQQKGDSKPLVSMLGIPRAMLGLRVLTNIECAKPEIINKPLLRKDFCLTENAILFTLKMY